MSEVKGWTPTEGHKRAEQVVQMLEIDGAATGHVFSPEFRWRMVQNISRAIDQALADGSEQDALNSMVGNGTGLPALEPITDKHWTQVPPGTHVSVEGEQITFSTERKKAPAKKARGRRGRRDAEKAT